MRWKKITTSKEIFQKNKLNLLNKDGVTNYDLKISSLMRNKIFKIYSVTKVKDKIDLQIYLEKTKVLYEKNFKIKFQR